MNSCRRSTEEPSSMHSCGRSSSAGMHRRRFLRNCYFQLRKKVLPCTLVKEVLPQECREERSSAVVNFYYGRTFFHALSWKKFFCAFEIVYSDIPASKKKTIPTKTIKYVPWLKNNTPKQRSLTSPHPKLSQSSKYRTTLPRRNKESNNVNKNEINQLFVEITR